MNKEFKGARKLLLFCVSLMGLCLAMSVSAWAATSTWSAEDTTDAPSWLNGGTVTTTSNSSSYNVFAQYSASGTYFTKKVAVASGGSFTIEVSGASTVKVYISANNNADAKGTSTAKFNDTTLSTYSLPSRKTTAAAPQEFTVDSAGTVTISVDYASLLFRVDVEDATVEGNSNIFSVNSTESLDGVIRVIGQVSADTDVATVTEVGLCITTVDGDAPSATNVYASDEHLGTNIVFRNISSANNFAEVTGDGTVYMADFYVSNASTGTTYYVYTYTLIDGTYYYSDTATSVVA